MTGNGEHTNYRTGDDWGMVQMALLFTHIVPSFSHGQWVDLRENLNRKPKTHRFPMDFPLFPYDTDLRSPKAIQGPDPGTTGARSRRSLGDLGKGLNGEQAGQMTDSDG